MLVALIVIWLFFQWATIDQYHPYGIFLGAVNFSKLLQQMKLSITFRRPELAVGQGVHRIDDDNLDAADGAVSINVIDNHDAVVQAF